jgi:hypothetical protein
MLNQLLLPHKFKRIGWYILIPAAILGIILAIKGFEGLSLQGKVFAFYGDGLLGKPRFFTFIHASFTNTLIGALFICGALLVGFSKEKQEDEFISKLRQSSLLWAVLVNYIVLLFCFVFVYGTAFLSIMVYNMFTVLIIFIGRFNYVLYRNIKAIPREKYN